MEEAIIRKLVRLNAEFYDTLAEPFSASRAAPQSGYRLLLPYLPTSRFDLLDIGCGNGRFGRFLLAEGVDFDYTGVDFSQSLAVAAGAFPGQFLERDLSRSGCLDELGVYHLIVALSAIQHIPARTNRERLLREMRGHLVPDGKIILANWQFLDMPRQRRKIRPWLEVDLDPAQLEVGDYLLSWERGGSGLRYVAYLDAVETRSLADAAGLRIIEQFRSDGREGNLNLYTILGG